MLRGGDDDKLKDDLMLTHGKQVFTLIHNEFDFDFNYFIYILCDRTAAALQKIGQLFENNNPKSDNVTIPPHQLPSSKSQTSTSTSSSPPILNNPWLTNEGKSHNINKFGLS